MLIPNTENVGAENNRFFVFDNVGDEPVDVGSATKQDVDPVQETTIGVRPSGRGAGSRSLFSSIGSTFLSLDLDTR